MINIGVVGYMNLAKYNQEDAWNFLKIGFDKVEEMFKGAPNFRVISGLTDAGVPQLAYYIARQRNWNCGGIAAEGVHEYRWFPMSQDGDILKIVKGKWGAESQDFIDSINVLIRVGGGKQTYKEVKMAIEKGIPVIEFDLENND